MMFDELTDAFEDQVQAGRIPGAVLWVCHKGATVLQTTLGVLDPARSVPMPLNAIFRIYSMTKPITSVAVLMLLEEGLIALDEPVRKYLPEFTNLKVGVEEPSSAGTVLVLQPATSEMTVRDLLRHTSGLTYGTFEKSLVKDEYIKSGVESRKLNNQDFVKKLAELPLAYQPGTTWEYSRATDVLGALVERKSGLTLGQFFTTRIFAPLGMVDTGFFVPGDETARLAEPFALDPETQAPVRVIDVRRPPNFESGGGGLVSTLADYIAFQSMLRNKGILGDVRLLRTETVEMMTRDHLGSISRGLFYLPGPDYGFGLGVAVRLRSSDAGQRGEYCWGGVAGTYQWVDPAREVAAILLIQAPNQREAIRSLFYQKVYRSLVRS